MCLAQGPQRNDAGVWSQALYHWATALPKISNVLVLLQRRQNLATWRIHIHVLATLYMEKLHTLTHLSQIDLPTLIKWSVLRVVEQYFIIFIQILFERSVSKQWKNWLDAAASGLTLRCLPMSHKKDGLQAGLSLYWSQKPHCWKSHVAAQLLYCVSMIWKSVTKAWLNTHK